MDRDSRAPRVVTDGGQRPAEDEVFCTECGSIIRAQAEICPECGVRQLPESGESDVTTGESTSSSSNEDAVIAAALSFFLPGLGQFYNGDAGKGVALLAGAVFSVVLMFLAIGFLTYPVVWGFAIYDAYHNAEE
jgi:TM2 domain-containing membrane protein YozV